MATRLLCYAIFFVLETAIILGSIVLVICVYFPFVALKGAYQTLTGRASIKTNETPRPSGA